MFALYLIPAVLSAQLLNNFPAINLNKNGNEYVVSDVSKLQYFMAGATFVRYVIDCYDYPLPSTMKIKLHNKEHFVVCNKQEFHSQCILDGSIKDPPISKFEILTSMNKFFLTILIGKKKQSTDTGILPDPECNGFLEPIKHLKIPNVPNPPDFLYPEFGRLRVGPASANYIARSFNFTYERVSIENMTFPRFNDDLIKVPINTGNTILNEIEHNLFKYGSNISDFLLDASNANHILKEINTVMSTINYNQKDWSRNLKKMQDLPKIIPGNWKYLKFGSTFEIKSNFVIYKNIKALYNKYSTQLQRANSEYSKHLARIKKIKDRFSLDLT